MVSAALSSTQLGARGALVPSPTQTSNVRWASTPRLRPSTCSLTRGARGSSSSSSGRVGRQGTHRHSYGAPSLPARRRELAAPCEALPSLGAVAVLANASAAADRAILTARLIGFAIGALGLSLALRDTEEEDDDENGGSGGTPVPIPLYVRVDEDRTRYGKRDIY